MMYSQRLFGSIVIVIILLVCIVTPARSRVISQIIMPKDGNLSAAIFDRSGQIIRTLLELSPYKNGDLVPLEWNGLDDTGKKAPAGEYLVKSICGSAIGVDDGWIGDMGNPTEAGENGTDVKGVAVDEVGNVYETSGWEEAHQELRIWSVDGKELRSRAAGGGRALALDDKYIYQLADTIGTIKRFTRDNLLLRPWTGTLNGIMEMEGGITAVAVGKDTIWVCGIDRVEVHEKISGGLLKSFPLPSPTGIAIDAQGNGWIASNGNRVDEFTVVGIKKREITGLHEPAALCFGGQKSLLYIAEKATGQVLEYDTATLKRLRTLFSAAKPGPISDTDLLWPLAGGTSVAVDNAGRITVADIGNHRVMTFNPDGTLLRMRYSEMVMAPMVDPTVNPDTVLSNNMEYQVDYSAGINHGKWKVINNWYGSGGAGVRRKLHGEDFLFTFEGKTVHVFSLKNNLMRACADIGVDNIGMYNWSDINGDGSKQEIEITRTEGVANYATLAPGLWVDHQGNILIANWNNETVKITCDGITTGGNPQYKWGNRKTIISADNTLWKCRATNLRVDPQNGDIYRLSSSEIFSIPNQWFWMGGSVVERYSATGKRISVFPIQGKDPAVVVATDTDGRFYYTGHSAGSQHWIRMYTNDGLLVAFCRMGGPSGDSGGWMDHGMSLTAFTHPRTGIHYAYAEEVYWGKAIRYRIDNLNTLHRPVDQTFTWNGEE